MLALLAAPTPGSTVSRIHLSPPDLGGLEADAVTRAVVSGWLAPVGPDLDAFEAEVAERTGSTDAVGTSSGTGALHVVLRQLGVGPGDVVLAPTFTFIGSVSPITFLGARPLFVDSEPRTWNLSPQLVADALAARARRNELPRAAIVVDLYGQCAAYDELLPLFARYDIPVIEDAAESLGASWRGQPAGSFGDYAVLSFNGNKIVTTSGGGMVLCRSAADATRIRYLVTQARQPAPHYEHTEIGYNYRLSNVLAALGRAQLATLDARIERRRELHRRYLETLAGLPGVGFGPLDPAGTPNFWLTCITLDPNLVPWPPEHLRKALEAADIEARPAWKPMHLQPVFSDAERLVDGTAQRAFETTLCLPSGSSMTDEDQDRVIDAITALF
jgi:dTDP-4-amino-4,6-dideoxygalactose transaminase